MIRKVPESHKSSKGIKKLFFSTKRNCFDRFGEKFRKSRQVFARYLEKDLVKHKLFRGKCSSKKVLKNYPSSRNMSLRKYFRGAEYSFSFPANKTLPKDRKVLDRNPKTINNTKFSAEIVFLKKFLPTRRMQF